MKTYSYWDCTMWMPVEPHRWMEYVPKMYRLAMWLSVEAQMCLLLDREEGVDMVCYRRTQVTVCHLPSHIWYSQLSVNAEDDLFDISKMK